MATSKAVNGGRSGCGTGKVTTLQNTSTDVVAPRRKAMSSPVKRAPRKAAARGKWSEATLLTSEKSVLVDADLVKLFASPQAWNCLDESEKREILALLPADTHPEAELQQDDPEAKIPPLPPSFLRYSNNWRDGIRQFQLDLENGRYDPEWLRQAEAARKQREEGAFDSFKEREFEQFWGQKQAFDKSSLAGESAKVKLSQLINDGVILLGDVWRFRYAYGKGEGSLRIDKEARIIGIDGPKLSFTIPTGTRTFVSSADSGTQKDDPEIVQNDLKAETDAKDMSSPDVPAESTAEKDATLPTSSKSPTADATAQEVELENSTRPPEEPQKENVTNVIPTEDEQPSCGAFQIVITNQSSSLKVGNEGLKRPIPRAESEPPAKRGRGRPRKIQPEQDTRSGKIQPEQETANSASKIPTNPSISVEINNSPYHSSLPISEATKSAQPAEQVSKSSSPISNIKPEGNTNSNLQPTTPNKKSQNQNQIQILSSSPLSPAQSTSPLSSNNESPNSYSNSNPNPKISPSPSQPASPTKPTSSSTTTTATAPKTTAQEIKINNIPSPNTFVTQILKIDGRNPNGRVANAWKEVRCYRNNQDIGSLWELREAWFLKQK